MNENEYLKNRLEEQISWYSTKSTTNKKFYYWFKTIEIVFAAVVPFLIALSDGECLYKIIAGIFSLFVGIVSGILIVFKFQEKWIQYRATSENLKHEKYLFETKSAIYSTNSDFKSLVERVEFIISKENSDWTQIVISNDSKNKNKQ